MSYDNEQFIPSRHQAESDVIVGDLTIRVQNDRARVVERRRKVGHDVLACEYVCGVLDSDEDGTCWSYDHGGPRCTPADVVVPPEVTR